MQNPFSDLFTDQIDYKLSAKVHVLVALLMAVPAPKFFLLIIEIEALVARELPLL